MNDLGQRFPGDLQWLSCSPGSCGMPKSSWSTSQRKTLLLLLLPYCPLLAVRISSVYTFCLIRKSSLSEILHWRMYPPIKVSFPLKSSHHLTAPNPHFSCMSQMEKKGRRWFVFFFSRENQDVSLTHSKILRYMPDLPEESRNYVMIPLTVNALSLHNYSRIGGAIADTYF